MKLKDYFFYHNDFKYYYNYKKFLMLNFVIKLFYLKKLIILYISINKNISSYIY